MIGTTFQINDARPYTENGTKGLHVRTLLATVTDVDRGVVSYKAEVVEEAGRPAFATEFGPTSGQILEASYVRRFNTGEWQIISTPGLA